MSGKLEPIEPLIEAELRRIIRRGALWQIVDGAARPEEQLDRVECALKMIQ